MFQGRVHKFQGSSMMLARLAPLGLDGPLAWFAYHGGARKDLPARESSRITPRAKLALLTSQRIGN